MAFENLTDDQIIEKLTESLQDQVGRSTVLSQVIAVNRDRIDLAAQQRSIVKQRVEHFKLNSNQPTKACFRYLETEADHDLAIHNELGQMIAMINELNNERRKLLRDHLGVFVEDDA
jgi:hypothetical protein